MNNIDQSFFISANIYIRFTNTNWCFSEPSKQRNLDVKLTI